MRRITTFLMLLVLATNSLNAAKAEVISIACNGGTYSIEMPSGKVTKDNGCTGSLILDSSVKHIDSFAFQLSKITSVVIPNSVSSIGLGAFQYNRNLKSVVLPNSIDYIGANAFSFTGLTTVVIPDSVIAIGDSAFFGNFEMTSIKLGKSLVSIGRSAFSGTKLTSLDIPDSVKTAEGAFSTDGSLKSIIYCGPFKGFPTSPTCPPERKAVIDAEKAIIDAAAKAEAEARAAAAYSCLQPPDTYGTEPIWKTSEDKDLKYVVSWAFRDPEKCIVGISDTTSISQDFRFKSYKFPTTWTITRDGEMALVSAETEFPIALLKALPRVDNETSQLNFLQTNKEFLVSAYLKIKRGGSYKEESILGRYGLAQLWADWFSKNQGIYPTNCKPVNLTSQKSDISVNWKILESGLKPKIEISVEEKNNCIFLMHTGPLEPLTNKVNFYKYEKSISQSQFSFDEGPGSLFFNSILSNPDKLIQIGIGEFASEVPEKLEYYHFNELRSKIVRFPTKVLNHSDSVLVEDNSIKIRSVIDGSSIDSSVNDFVTVYLGIYQWSFESSSFVSSGWNVTYSGSTWTARYREGSSIPGGNYYKYSTRAIKIPVADLFLSEEVKAAASVKAATEKAAAELKAKQEAEAKAAAELKAKQEAEAKVAEDLKAKQEAEAKAAAQVKAKTEAEAKVAAELKAKQEADAQAAAKASALKKTTITCIKGKLTKKVTAVKPVCPKGYKKK
jgi:hypothetical protein